MIFKDSLHDHLVAADPNQRIVPESYAMPGGTAAWRGAAAADPDVAWLRKPKAGSKGEGIALVTEANPMRTGPDWLVQRYVSNPFLLPDHHFKHVLRVYVLITCLDPLIAYVHRNGVVKFTSRTFTMETSSRDDPVVHLTNPPIQEQNHEVPDPVRTLEIIEYLARLRDLGIDAAALWGRIRTMLQAMLDALRGPVVWMTSAFTSTPSSCFELLGCDVLIDSDLHPWLMECNMSPSLGLEANPGPHREPQRKAKREVVTDMLRLIGAELEAFETAPYPDRADEEQARLGSFEVLVG